MTGPRASGDVLVTGATGFVGRALVDRLVTSGAHVRGAVRTLDERTAARPGVTWLAPSPGGAHDWHAAVQGVDAIVHLAARTHQTAERGLDALARYREENVEATRLLAEAAASAGVRRFVFVSSIKVNGERTAGAPFRASDPPAPEDAYGVSKHEAEQALAAVPGALERVVVRPPLVYGPGVGGNFQRLMRLVRARVPLPLRSVRNERSLVSRDNLVNLLLLCLTSPAAAGRTFLVADGPPISTPGLIRAIAFAMHSRPRLVPVPAGALRLAGRAVGAGPEIERLCGSLVVDDSQTRETLGWHPPVSQDDAVAATVRAFLGHSR